MGINKVQYGNTTLIDLTSDTVTADKLMQGYTAHDRTGALITGTATGGGSGGNVWQDAQGYVHLDDEGTAPITVESLSVTQNGTYTATTGHAYSPVTVNVSGGGGLEYETGTWTPSEDINITSILFANTHTVAPTFFMISDVDPSYSNTTNSVYNVMYYNFHQLFGVPYDINNAGSLNYGYVYRRYRNSSTGLTGGVIPLTYPYTDQSESLNRYPRYWVTETGITAKTANSEYYRANRTYKWIAVWAPTT